MRQKKEILDDSINVPLTSSLKRRVVRLAKSQPESPAPTAFARSLIEQGVEQLEKVVGNGRALVTAGK